MVGQFGWAIAFCLPTITICRFGLRILLTTDSQDEFGFGTYLTFGFLGALVGLAAVMLMVAVQGYELSAVLLLMAVAVWNSIESVSDVFTGLFLRRERMDYVAKA